MKNNKENKGIVITLASLYKCAAISVLIYFAIRFGYDLLAEGQITFSRVDLFCVVLFVTNTVFLRSEHKKNI